MPMYAGVKPYEPVPFQWSDHVVDAHGSEHRHNEFLHADSTDPRPRFAESLMDALQGAGTILHYATYERTILKLLVSRGIPHASELLALLDAKGLDLERVVKDHVYLAEFYGKTSIKRVYPALVPDGGYKDLDIQGGDHAASEYVRMQSPATTETERRRIARSLLAYCERDTLAMVQVFDALVRLSGAPTSP
jgi:hypothetical protein